MSVLVDRVSLGFQGYLYVIIVYIYAFLRYFFACILRISDYQNAPWAQFDLNIDEAHLASSPRFLSVKP